MISKTFIILITILSLTGLAKSENSVQSDLSKTQNIIENQIQAFQSKDAELAFSYAAPIIKLKFNNPDEFMTMVKNY